MRSLFPPSSGVAFFGVWYSGIPAKEKKEHDEVKRL
jgi:hypothetical protein